MRSLLRAFLLPLLLLIAQQGALLHELSHYRADSSPQQKQTAPESKACDICLAYGHIAHGVDIGLPPPATLLSLAQPQPKAPAHTVAFVADWKPRSRGPPPFL